MGFFARYIGVPRSVINEAVGEMGGWRHLGERILEQAKASCPVAEEVEGWQGPHLKDTLQLKLITGSDPRLLIGTTERGTVLGYLTEGTTDHFVAPVNAKALRFTSGGTVMFSAGHQVRGIKANPFIIEAAKRVLHD